MKKCKHNRLTDNVKTGQLPRISTQYYCTQCQSWITAEPINREADRRKMEEREKIDQLRREEE